jgi:para-nitrobenzyl esterase
MRLTPALALAATLLAPAAAPAAVVKLDSGPVNCAESGPANVCRAIPYAAPPLGALRWRPPQKVARWKTARDATRAGPACLQTILPGGIPNGGGYTGPVSEDCLTLDVTAPLAKPPMGKRWPVLVWIPGGGNVAGGANVPSYDAVNFARDGVVVVTMNYRMGALGFFAHPALTREADAKQPLVNYGLMDQIAALEWVKRNIHAFGGDPGKVTLSGESAGGADTLALLATPRARGLFRQAIVQSGFGWNKPVSMAEREAQGVATATRLGLPGAQATAEQLRALPAAQLAGGGEAGVAIDGRLVRETPVQAFARGHQARVNLIIGWNSNEASLLGRADPAAFVAAAPAPLRAAYADAPSDAERMRQIFGDGQVGAPARWFARHVAAPNRAWLYYFSYVPERQRQNAEGTNAHARPGTNHASEIPFVFDSLDAVPGRTPLITPSERAVALLTHACWLGFIRTGRPDCGGQPWPAYDPATDQLLEIGADTGVRTHFHQAGLDAAEAASNSLLRR